MLFCMDTQLKKWRFTEYGNRIGLMLAQSGEVVLSFPFKDAILEGGMSREDTGREERFFHLTQDRSDIDTLQERKVLTGFRRIDSSGDHEITSPEEVEFFDSEWELRSNLLIKGNNLVALYTLRDRLAGKVKLIYIDPPYNTGNDGFRYNDNFNHSTWLAFMKNRLEIARELLRDDGVIFVQCDDNEQAYLKVLMDELFGRENFLSSIVWKKKVFDNNNQIPQLHEQILVFGKRNTFDFNLLKRSEEQLKKYKNLDNDPRWPYNLEKLTANTQGGRYSKATDFIIVDPETGKEFESNTKNWRFGKDTIEQMIKEGRIDFSGSLPRYRLYLNEIKDGVSVNSWWDDCHHNLHATKEIQILFDTKIFDTPKPEKLLERIIQISTQPWDIVLDYHLGSGTTAAVAHKMGRRWIGIEQMDYIEDIAKVRLQKVIEGEQGGVSKSVGWQWGGEFVYLELKTYNEEYLERIELARTKEELHRVYADMARNAFLQFWFDRRDFERDGYKALPLEEQKVKLRDILDLNHLYLNYHDMRDARHRVSPIDQSLTDAFYGS